MMRRSDPSCRPALRVSVTIGAVRRQRSQHGSIGRHPISASPHRTQHGGVRRGTASQHSSQMGPPSGLESNAAQEAHVGASSARTSTLVATDTIDDGV